MYLQKDLTLGWYFCFQHFSLNVVQSSLLPATRDWASQAAWEISL